jgi:class 3 adenylate cyclase/tetratricopeptide (TPR) repeat protein/predicted Ser/Thr protein kinase
LPTADTATLNGITDPAVDGSRPSSLQPGAVLDERFTIVEELGRGGMGVVYKAHDRVLNEIVAIKTLRTDRHSEDRLVQRLSEEIKLARRVRHENVAGVYELGISVGLPFVSMEYVKGETLRVLIRGGTLELGNKLEIVEGICSGLKAAHDLGIIHRDLKPQNVMVTGKGKPLILDFGLASLMGGPEDSTCRFAGTPGYMAPEQIAGRPVGPQTDIYALGIIMYELFTGRAPFAGESPRAIAGKHLNEAPVAPSRIGIDLPEILESIILKTLEKDMNRRHQSVGDLLAELAKVSISQSQRDGIGDRAVERARLSIVSSGLSEPDTVLARIGTEEMSDLTSLIVDLVRQAVTRYGGEVESRFGADALIVFGRRSIHEDDALRAAKAAIDIHSAVKGIGSRFGGGSEIDIAMRTGVATGVVLTSGIDSHEDAGITGNAVSLSSKLQEMACADEILVDQETRGLVGRYFSFSPPNDTRAVEPAFGHQIYSLVGPISRLESDNVRFGCRASLTGRDKELDLLRNAVNELRTGRGSVFRIIGAAGTGKSRLIEELKPAARENQTRWLEGHAYSYNQTVPYWPLVDLVSGAANITDDHSPHLIEEALRSWVEPLMEDAGEVLPFVGSLFSLVSPELRGMSPDYWKAQLQKSLRSLVAALINQQPTVICFEDLHWSDPSSLEMIGLLQRDFAASALFVITQRPERSLGVGEVLQDSNIDVNELHLEELNAKDTEAMTAALLGTSEAPDSILKIVNERSGGNPLFVEELVKSLEETGCIELRRGNWTITGHLSEAEIPATVQGVISARINRLSDPCRRVIQEASVIGRQFDRQILREISKHPDQVGGCLSKLQDLDLVGAVGAFEETQFRFKHILTCEVAYESLPRKRRRRIHDLIAEKMEVAYSSRLDEFCEAISYHHDHGNSRDKAVQYLRKAAEKNYRRYALEESHQFYERAYVVLTSGDGQSNTSCSEEIVDLLNSWGFVFHLRGAYDRQLEMLEKHKDVVLSLEDEDAKGMYLVWLGWSLQRTGHLQPGEKCLRDALDIGEYAGNHRVIGYASALLAWNCVEMGRYNEAIALGTKGREIARFELDDSELYRMSWTGVGYAKYCQGNGQSTAEVGRDLLRFGEERADIRSLTMGHLFLGLAQYINGDFEAAIDCYRRSIDVSVDPTFALNADLALAHCCILAGRLEEAEIALSEITRRETEQGYSYRIQAVTAHGLLGVIELARGRLEQGKRIIEEVLEVFEEYQHSYYSAGFEHVLGRLYLKIVLREGPRDPKAILKNLRFILTSVPFASRRAERHLRKSIALSRKIGALCAEGQAQYDLGLLCEARKKTFKARRHLRRAVSIFEEIDALCRLGDSRRALARLDEC